MASSAIIIALLGYCIIREVYFMYAMNKLLNKAMTGNYYEFKQAESLGKQEPDKLEIPEDDPSFDQELRRLNEF